jgi:hypothetical protein
VSWYEGENCRVKTNLARLAATLSAGRAWLDARARRRAFVSSPIQDWTSRAPPAGRRLRPGPHAPRPRPAADPLLCSRPRRPAINVREMMSMISSLSTVAKTTRYA